MASKKTRDIMRGKLPRTLVLENLPVWTNETEIRETCEKFGHIKNIVLEEPVSTSKIAYVEFYYSMEADAALWKLNDFKIHNQPIKVQLVEKIRGKRVTCHRFPVIVRGISSSVSRKELEAHMACVGEITFCTVIDDHDEGRYAIVNYLSVTAMRKAVSELDNTKLREGMIRVQKYQGSTMTKLSPTRPTPSAIGSASSTKKRRRSRSTSPRPSSRKASKKA